MRTMLCLGVLVERPAGQLFRVCVSTNPMARWIAEQCSSSLGSWREPLYATVIGPISEELFWRVLLLGGGARLCFRSIRRIWCIPHANTSATTVLTLKVDDMWRPNTRRTKRNGGIEEEEESHRRGCDAWL